MNLPKLSALSSNKPKEATSVCAFVASVLPCVNERGTMHRPFLEAFSTRASPASKIKPAIETCLPSVGAALNPY